LESIGFEIKLINNKMGTFISFLLEQYKYKNKVFIKKGDYVIDGGGCYGDTALYFADMVKDQGKVFSFEFIKDNLDIFNKNIKLNPDKRDIIELVERPLWSFSETEFSAVGSGAGSRLSNIKENENAQLYKTISIDDFVAKNKIEKINFIKLDIEGAELEALKGAIKTIEKYKPQLAICVYHKNSDFWEIPRFLKDLVPEYELYLDHFVINPFYETVLFARIIIKE
jgi:FkbM family methyltransferase